MTDVEKGVTYAEAGVDTAREETALKKLLRLVDETRKFKAGTTKIGTGYFASVVDLGGGKGLAVSTDGVGTKILVAQMVGRYDTVGIDCVAMNVNDILCVGAEPISFLDYIAVREIDPEIIEEIGRGLLKGAEIARVAIVGGEIAQLRDMLSPSQGYEFDLVGMAMGLVPLDKVVLGQNLGEGDVVVGLRSSGVHSNGLTLARHVFFKLGGVGPHQYFEELGRPVGEELLEPTRIYVPIVLDVMRRGLNIKALIHITGDGFLNLRRVEAKKGFVIDNLPKPHPIFGLIQKLGKVSDEEMFKVYNMGIGFCIVVPKEEAEEVITTSEKHGVEAFKIGYVVEDPDKKVLIKQKNLVGLQSGFHKV